LEGKSCTLEITFSDLQSTPVQLTEANITTLTCTLREDDNVLNSRLDQDVKDANGGILSADGSFVLKLDAADNTIEDTSIDVGDLKEHFIEFTWTWTDGDGDAREGGEEYVFWVKKAATPT
jgi:hypothetical protein